MLAGLLFFIFFSLLAIGIVKPKFFNRFFVNPPTKSYLIKIFTIPTIIFFILIPNKNSNVIDLEKTPKQSTTTNIEENNKEEVSNTVSTSLPTSTPTSTITTVKVTRVVDGDTIEIEGGKVVRYIGIDTPELVHPSKPIQCYAKEASTKNKELVLNKEVRLEKDISETDKYGRLLRYIWVGETLINELLVREGYAQSSSYPPDIKYQNRFIEAQKIAREEKKGLWSSYCTNSNTTTINPSTKTSTPIVYQQQSENNNTYVCDCSKTCSNMSSCDEAQYQLNICGCSARDADKDGIACDTDCQ